ncbi:MAG: DUF2272 domain-containing protein [Pseudomonadota bacterium]|uniref:DUF2272 domain-containing protein n=1 Tax=Polaromonas sp. TaxID=1869339 RepID=UPI00180419C1|nr:DUF2272 domain-containing protein [Polaromonas sp.]MBA3594450.1 DUF2272 domain-containing protein [Polaromonas sp.]MDQ3272749.1 DUF2272 domain-containing protein [Pseudomonadota bacterium]
MSFIQKMVQVATEEWEFFGKQEFGVDGKAIRNGMSETDDGFWQRVALYWREGTGKNLTGKNDDYPWSATFISYVMRKSGAGTKFRYSAQHSVYIRSAIRARAKEDRNYGFWAYGLSERAPKIGDLVCYAREPGISLDSLSANYKSHADLVVGVSENSISVIGGNVGNSVSMKSLKLNAKGRLADKQKLWFAVLANKFDDEL